MTVQPLEMPTVDLGLDIAALVGEMEAVPCEHPGHESCPSPHSDAPASHYAQSNCPDCGRMSAVIALCPGFVAYIAGDGLLACPACDSWSPASKNTRILGPVNK